MRKREPFQPHQDDEALIREQAVNAYLTGQTVADICQQLQRSRAWFYKTWRRYQTGGRAGLASQSRRPKHSPRRTAPEVETAIERVRKAIAEGQDPLLRYSNIGAEAIASELERSGLPVPSLATIYRILGRLGLLQPRVRKKAQAKSAGGLPLAAGARTQ
jgi:putative transposase